MKVLDPYSSRIAGHWEAIERQDPVVWSPMDTADLPGPLDREQLADYQNQGFLFRESLFGDEIERLRAEADRLAEMVDRRSDEVITEPNDETIVRTIFRVHRDNELFRRVCCDPRIVNSVRQLLGSDVYIHQSRINYKPALNGKEFFWHSDFETWHIEDGMPRMRAVSVSLSLTENTEFNGPLMIVPGSHLKYVRCVGATPVNHFQQSLKKQQYGVPSCEALELLVDQGGITAPKGPAGSAIIFDCNTMHGSVGNLSPRSRINLFVVYNSIENGLEDPFGGMPPRPEFLAEREIVPV